jgi:hypothetical protein
VTQSKVPKGESDRSRIVTNYSTDSQYDAPPPLREAVCLPACLTMVLEYWKVDRPLAENALAVYDPDTGMFGNGARAVARAGALGRDGWLQRVRDWGQVQALLRRGQPVIAAVHRETGQPPIVIRGFTADGDVIVNGRWSAARAERGPRRTSWGGRGLVVGVRLCDPAACRSVSTRRGSADRTSPRTPRRMGPDRIARAPQPGALARRGRWNRLNQKRQERPREQRGPTAAGAETGAMRAAAWEGRR